MHWTLVTTRSRNQTIKQNEIAGLPLFAPGLLYFSPFFSAREFLLALFCCCFCAHAPLKSSFAVIKFWPPWRERGWKKTTPLLLAGFRLPMLLWHVFASVASVHLARFRPFAPTRHLAAVGCQTKEPPFEDFSNPQPPPPQNRKQLQLQLPPLPSLYILFLIN